MEKVTPLDLEKASLPHSFRGYETQAVDKMLLTASHQLEAQLIEIRRLQAQLKTAETELERLHSLESTMNSALLLAQKAADETRALAHKEGENIIESAKQEAREIKRSANESIRAQKWDAERLAAQNESFQMSFRALLQEHLRRLDSEPVTHAVLQVEHPEVATG